MFSLLFYSLSWGFLASMAQVSSSPVATNYHGVDFNNFSFPYRDHGGHVRRIVFKKGILRNATDPERDSFTISNVFVADVTGDKRAEAIVFLSHVQCGVSCDGGSLIIYVFKFENKTLRPLLQFETGSLGYGCGLKSFSARNGKLNIELFGRCNRKNDSQFLGQKFHSKDITHVQLTLVNNRFAEISRAILPTADVDVLDYKPEISLGK